MKHNQFSKQVLRKFQGKCRIIGTDVANTKHFAHAFRKPTNSWLRGAPLTN
ncbi:hypothetical protein WMW72_24500 [Paenibacillus filicis]|uniref:Uncharacterized protein n=1 Tax=Paenibacillus filicis TaxID=669464 RepID=A0ABU9DTK7_9BACL